MLPRLAHQNVVLHVRRRHRLLLEQVPQVAFERFANFLALPGRRVVFVREVREHQRGELFRLVVLRIMEHQVGLQPPVDQA